MSNQVVIATLERQNWLQPVENTLRRIIKGLFHAAGRNGQTVEDFLHGKWLGHPLHSALTDVPIGAWTTSVVLDGIDAAAGRKEFGTAADAAIGFGLIGAVAAAATGLTDWQHVSGGERRVGLVHGLTNIGGVALFTASLVARNRGRRNAGRVLSVAGLAVASTAAWLGGHLVYEKQVGVDHTATESFPPEFVPVMRSERLKEGQMHRVEVGGAGIILVRRKNEVHALAETCTHMGGPLSEGKLVDGAVQCPWHGSQFDLADGHVISGPAVYPEPCLDVRTRNGQIEVRIHCAGGIKQAA